MITTTAQARIPTKYGEFLFTVFRHGQHTEDHVALVMGDVTEQEAVLVRVHSECLTSEVFGSLKCDCRDQLEAAQKEIGRRKRGVLLYLRQEGRGIGLANKIRAYALQSQGHDTVDANRVLGLPDDSRDYAPAAEMLRHLGVSSVQLLTNNPEKVAALRSLGVAVLSRVPSIVLTNPFSEGYLNTKRDRMGHLFEKEAVT